MPIESLRGSRLEQIWLSGERYPGIKVEIWNPRQTTIQDVVLDRAQGSKLEITRWVEQIDLISNQVFENSDDAVSSRCRFDVLFDDAGVSYAGFQIPISERLFRDGTPIRVYQGDERISKDDWPAVFTGVIRGTPGAEVAKRGKRIIRCQAFGRAQSYQSQKIVGISWVYGTDLGAMAVDTAMQEMGLERQEIRFGNFNFTTKHKANALTQIGKMQGINELMKPVHRRPYFDGRGFLVSHDLSFDKPPVRFYDHSQVIASVVRDQNLNSVNNSVEVIGLDKVQTKVPRPVQELAKGNVTTGYFDSHFREHVYYSKDHTLRAENTYVKKRHGKMFGEFGGGSSTDWTEIDEFHGRVDIDTGYAPWIFATILLGWVWGWKRVIDGENEGSTSKANRGRLVVGASQLLLLYAMSTLGRFEFTVYGEPYEYVFQELRAVAVLHGIPVADIQEKTERIHWLTDIADAQTHAKKLLRRELVKQNQYKLIMLDDSMIELDDVIAIKDEAFGFNTFHYFYITAIQKNLVGNNQGFMNVTAWLCKVE